MRGAQLVSGEISAAEDAEDKPTCCTTISWHLIPESACWLNVMLMTEPPLRTVYWYVTSACNQHCRHRWIDAGTKRGSELSTEQLI
ncbi:MAG: hypothetical protein AYK19_11070 [Theionarchaea archaeon DG-70-1]|nr:MAG: hypothetical protein AYK19_11070 [Theionarchaea archaeon DG-70-1]